MTKCNFRNRKKQVLTFNGNRKLFVISDHQHIFCTLIQNKIKTLWSFLLSFLLCTVFISCGQLPTNVEKTLENSGANRKELEKVIAHYRMTGEKDKLRAAYFLIGNMTDKFSFDGRVVRNYDVIFDILDSLHKKKIQIPVTSPIFQAKWDSIVNIYGNPLSFEADKFEDSQHITARYLIENIDLSFEQWKHNRFTTQLTFEQFCEYILPYRVHAERTEAWRDHLFEKFKLFRDTVKASSRFEFAKKLNYKLKDMIYLNHTIRGYPYAMMVSQMEKGKRGACTHLVAYTAAVMRAIGMPVGIDYTTRWGDLDRGHEWNVLFMDNGKTFPFDAGSSNFGGPEKTPYRLSKVYRRAFAKQNLSFPPKEEIPKKLIDFYAIDVTQEYIKTYTINIPLSKNFPLERKYALISTFGRRDWEPQDWGVIRNHSAQFKNIGANLLYIVMYFKNGRYHPASDPFILDKRGKIHPLNLLKEKKQQIILFRKYPYLSVNTVRAKELLGGRIQVANRPDFKDAVTLFTITQKPLKFETATAISNKKFKYVRYLSAKNHGANIAELEFIDSKATKLTGKIIGFPEVSYAVDSPYQHAFDGNLETYFSADTVSVSWAGLKFSKPEQLSKIRYCPRSDTNFIIVGDTYELRYWNGNQWISFGKQVAVNQDLIFKHVPSNTVYLLKDLTHGTEERIFTYEKGEQVWW
jgi:hypothetical protein